MSSTYGKNLRISLAGQSHSKGMGVIIDGFPVGFTVDFEKLQTFLNRRAPGNNDYSTKRKEADAPEFLSGLVDGTTCGAPILATIANTNCHSVDYEELKDIPRPSHADFTAQVKYKGFQDVSGGGHFSGRLTAPLCVAGGLALQYLESRGIYIFAHIKQIHNITSDSVDYSNLTQDELNQISRKDFPVLDDNLAESMKNAILNAAKNGDSVGGVIECVVLGLPAGVGDPMFERLEGRISSTVFGIPAVRGIEFGNGFQSASLYGSENNDPFYFDGYDVKTATNNAGGLLGGISNGMPLIFRAAIKPTPSIAKEQQSISFSQNKEVRLTVKGRHDPCIVQRAVPAVEAAAAISVLDAYLDFIMYKEV